MLSIDALRSEFASYFTACEPIGDSIARFVRSNQGHPFAVYYVDVSGNIPDSLDRLDAYQDNVIASRYFQGPKSLQWSHYLFFVVSTTVAGEIRSLVERDRKYARKFIVDESELRSALTPPKFQIAEGVVDVGVLSRWTELLAEANLDHAVFNNDSLPQRIKRIEADFGHKGLGPPSPVVIRHKEAPPFISSVELIKYRPCPRKRSFDFGTVTLLTGANGSGKTSLLESIELLYCGVNKRDQKSKNAYSIRAVFRDGRVEEASLGRPSASELRDRNLAWYGQADVRTNTLFQSFSQYNFLDTDAAVAVADSKKDYEEDLSKLLVGPEASKTWREIERTQGELERTLKELTAVEQQVQRELAAVEKQILAAASIPKESDSLVKALSEKLADAELSIPAAELTGRIPGLISLFATLEPTIEQAMSCDWIESPVTVQSLRDFDTHIQNLLAAGEEAMLECQSSLERLQKTKAEAFRLIDSEKEIDEFLVYLNEQFWKKQTRLVDAQTTAREVQRKLAGRLFDTSELGAFAGLSTTISKLRSEARARFERSQADVLRAKSQLSEFTKLRDRAAELSQQLRDIAAQILSRSEEKDICPLCHLKHGPGELNLRIYQEIDAQTESESIRLRDSLRRAEDAAEIEKKDLAIAEWLWEIASESGFSDTVEVSVIVSKVIELNRQESDVALELDRAKNEFDSLQKMGLTPERYRDLERSVLGATVAKSPTDIVKELSQELVAKRQANTLSLDACEKELSQKLLHTAGLLGIGESTLEQCRQEFAIRKKRREIVRAILKEIDSNEAQLKIKAEQPLAEILRAVKLIRNLLTDVQTSLANETQAVVLTNESLKRKSEIRNQLEGLQPRIDRLRQAEEVFRSILENHSLASAMEDALQQNKVAIEEIFGRIHSPPEFSRLHDMMTLIRKDGQQAKLHQISTGQRAAYALSLFLAQNAQLRSAPQLMLIDDPIAHVDDLNSLSFLDYLREVALTRERQIVFATANEKLASLFERKFDFLGPTEFVRHDLVR